MDVIQPEQGAVVYHTESLCPCCGQQIGKEQVCTGCERRLGPVDAGKTIGEVLARLTTGDVDLRQHQPGEGDLPQDHLLPPRAALGGERPVSICRELTKLHEEVIRTTLGEAAERFSAEPPRGEFVLVVAGAPEDSSPRLGEDEALELVRRYRESGLSLKDAAKKAAAESGWSRNELYSRALR